VATGQASKRFFLLLLALSAVLLVLVARPIATALFLGAVAAGVLWPLHVRLTRRLGGRRAVSAGLFVFGVVSVLVAPLVGFSAFAVKEGRQGVAFVTTALHEERVDGLVRRLPGPLEKLAREALQRLPGSKSADGQEPAAPDQKQLGSQGGKAASAVGATLSATGALLFQLAMMLIALYFALLQGDALVGWIDDVSPLEEGQTRELLLGFKKVSFAIVTSTLITSAVQAAAALGGYLIARFPHPLFFCGVTFFAAFIPAIGAGSVCLAAAAILWLTGHPYAALFLAAWGLVVVGLIDNVIKPFLAKSGMNMPGAVVFFALIGGIGAFGAVGLLLGPLVVALFVSLVTMYQRDFSSEPRAKTTRAK
jgi:predicted PurR-regulated permease PerM